MKNKEKYAKEILEIACNGDSIAVKNNKLTCCRCLDCYECLFNGSGCCRKQVKKWSESEYIEKPVISKKDRAFLDYIKEEYKFIARDENGKLFVYTLKPCKDKNFKSWCLLDCRNCRISPNLCLNYNIVFPMIKWSDKEPWLIEDLKKLEVVEEYG